MQKMNHLTRGGNDFGFFIETLGIVNLEYTVTEFNETIGYLNNIP